MTTKIFKNITIILVVTYLSSCSFGLDKEYAESLIQANKLDFNETDIKECNAKEVIVVNGNYLFVMNSFNGYLYSKNTNQNFEKMKFNDFYITHCEKTKELWTRVYGK